MERLVAFASSEMGDRRECEKIVDVYMSLAALLKSGNEHRL